MRLRWRILTKDVQIRKRCQRSLTCRARISKWSQRHPDEPQLHNELRDLQRGSSLLMNTAHYKKSQVHWGEGCEAKLSRVILKTREWWHQFMLHGGNCWRSGKWETPCLGNGKMEEKMNGRKKGNLNIGHGLTEDLKCHFVDLIYSNNEFILFIFITKLDNMNLCWMLKGILFFLFVTLGYSRPTSNKLKKKSKVLFLEGLNYY